MVEGDSIQSPFTTRHSRFLLLGAFPARALLLPLGIQHEAARLRVLPYGGAGAYRHPLRDRHGGDELHVGADMDIVLDHGAMLVRAVVVAGDRPRADVHVAAHRSVTDIGEMVGLGPRGDPARLHLDEVPDMHVLAELRAGPDPGVRADAAPLADFRVV